MCEKNEITGVDLVRALVWILVENYERMMVLEDSMIVYALGFVARNHERIKTLFSELGIFFDFHSYPIKSCELSGMLDNLPFSYIAELYGQRRYSRDDSQKYTEVEKYLRESGYGNEFDFLKSYLGTLCEQTCQGSICLYDADIENEYLFR